MTQVNRGSSEMSALGQKQTLVLVSAMLFHPLKADIAAKSARCPLYRTVDEKDINVSLDDNQLIVSGEKKAESTKEEKDWHVEERSYGSFYRSMLLPFEPEEGAVEAHFDKGVLHLKIKKPAKVVKTTKTISIKTGAPPSTSPISNKAAPSKAA